MTDKQLRSLSKTQLFSLLHKQELEIERLNSENTKLSEQAVSLEQAGSLAEASILVSGIMESAQRTADIYLESIQKVESAKLESISRLEEEAKQRALRTIELKNAESKARIEQLVNDMLQFFDNQVSSFAVMKEDLTELIIRNDLEYIIPGNDRTEK
jgi:hypothetical protein